MATPPYDHSAIEKKWQDFWVENKTFKAEIDLDKPKYYVLDMFPYPSGDGLHVGHPEGYTATDIVARYKRMRGFNVLHPMGWDAFGLPAERHAVRTGEHPSILTNRNCETFKRQIQALGLSYDWDREINTTDPKYYKWTQWIFTVLFERGLAYETEAAVNWCPALGTVLANEEVKDGKYVETGDPVEKRMMRQWMLRITDYAEKLLAGLDDVDWPEGIKTMQREWIGRSEGADVEFNVAGHDACFMVFTTRPDTLFGATYCVLAPEHPLTKTIATDDQRSAVDAYIAEAGRKSAQDRMKDDREKTGVFTGAYAINPVNGKEVPIWIADYVLAEYGYGAIMAVPAHDERDHAFARKFDLPIIEVVAGGDDVQQESYVGDGLHVNSSSGGISIDGLNVPDAKKKITAWLEEQGVGTGTVNYKLRDWLFARQRYWGEPFPVVRTQDGTVKVAPIKDLPVMLPDLDEYKPTADGQPPLARATEWLNATDPDTGQPAMRDTNTMPQWAGSCWYFLRFCDANNDEAAWSKEAEEYWMPVDLYIGGAEHAVLHLLYSRFWHKVLYDAGYVHTSEPFQKLFNQGMILAESYRTPLGEFVHTKKQKKLFVHTIGENDGKKQINTSGEDESVSLRPFQKINSAHANSEATGWLDVEAARFVSFRDDDFIFQVQNESYALRLQDVDIAWVADPSDETRTKAAFNSKFDGKPVEPRLKLNTQIEKMSKARMNVVNPDEVVEEYGADTMRLYEMFMGPLDRDKPWSDEGVQGVFRFLKRVWALYITEDGISAKFVESGGNEGVLKSLHKTIKAVAHDIEHLQFNTAIARMMEFVNDAHKADTVDRAWMDTFVLVVAPFAPHMAEELWQRMGHETTLAYEPFPDHDESLLVEDTIEVPVQVNGKMRGKIAVPADADQDAVLTAAKADSNVAGHLDGKNIVKEIYVPGRMVNLVVK